MVSKKCREWDESAGREKGEKMKIEKKDIIVFGRDTEYDSFWKEYRPRKKTICLDGEVVVSASVIGINIEG